MTPDVNEHFENGFRIRVAADWDSPDFLKILQNLSPENLPSVKMLQDGRHRVYRAQMPRGNATCDVVVKTYGKQAYWRDYLAKRGKGSKAARAFEVARHLCRQGIATPRPIAVVERWDGNRLSESHFVCEYVPALSDLRTELNRIFHRVRDCEILMSLLEPVAKAVRRLHDAGVIHRDLGNQNIGLRQNENGQWSIFFLDLNRAQIFPKLTEKQRGKDLSRLDIPSGIFNEFLCIYGASQICRNAEKKARRFFELHSVLRPLRHPIREYKLRQKDGQSFFYNFFEQQRFRRSFWLWDKRSSQAISVFNAQDRRKMRPLRNGAAMFFAWLRKGFAIHKAFREIDALSFSESRDFSQTVGIALEPNPETWNAQLKWLRELQGEQRLPILLRIYQHKPRTLLEYAISQARKLHADGNTVAFALVQSRDSVTHPERWQAMLNEVFEKTQDFADFYEIGHATNRGKWGVLGFKEYADLLAPALKAKARFPHIIAPAIKY